MLFGIIGNGFVGKATSLLSNEKDKSLIYDIKKELCCPVGLSISDLIDCELIFICLPTPMFRNGECNLSIIDSVIKQLIDLNYNSGNIIIRSTVPVGTSDQYKCNFMPEFLTEKNYLEDFKNNESWIFGIYNYNTQTRNKINDLFLNAFQENKINYNNMIFVTNKEAEITKYFRNTFLALKVSFCNEIYNFCKNNDIDYDNVKHLFSLDKRITNSHTDVPGNDGKFGFGGTCFPKDCYSLINQMQKVNVNPVILNAVIERNNNIDRPVKDWINEGRSTTNI